MRLILAIAGVAALLMGLLWTAQGLGVVRWPAESFMIDQRPWVTRGLILAAIGFLAILIARRRR